MNADRLLRHYERIVEAPDAVARLRRFVLDLAVRGKLVPQDPNDEPAVALLKRIHDARKHKRRFAQLNESDLEIPFVTLPRNWTWTTIDQTADDNENAITDGPFGSQLKTAHYIAESGFRVIRLQNIGSGVFREEHRSYIDRSRFERLSKHHVAANDLVVAGLVDPRIRCCVVPASIGPALVKADCYRLSVHPQLSSYFALHFLNSPLAQEFAAIHHHGMTLTRIGLGNFRRIPIPLPPLAEQHRIVAKVNDLMALCDELDAARATREVARDRLTTATLARLNAPDPDAAVFTRQARLAFEVLPALTTRADQIKQIRQAILNLTVRGKLVPQDPRDEPAGGLLKRIQKLRKEHVAAGVMRAEKKLQPPDVHKALFRPPRGWAWVLANNLWDFENGDRGSNYPSRDQLVRSGVPFVNAGHLVCGKVELDAMNYITRQKFDNLGGGKLRKGDQLYCLRGSLGKHGVFDHDMDAAIASSLVILRPVFDICVPYLSLYLDSDIARAMLSRFDNGSAQPNLSSANLRRYEIPLPPLPEQHRIVAKVQELMELCDRLDASLTASDETRRRLLDALLAEALRVAAPRGVERVRRAAAYA